MEFVKNELRLEQENGKKNEPVRVFLEQILTSSFVKNIHEINYAINT